MEAAGLVVLNQLQMWSVRCKLSRLLSRRVVHPLACRCG